MPNISPTPSSRPPLAPLGPPGFHAFQEARSRYLRRFTPAAEAPSAARPAGAIHPAPPGARPG